MAHVKKIVTYDLPDEFEQATPTTALGKTSTQSYDGPSTLILWIDKESKVIDQTWDKDDYTERPVPLNCEVKEIKADSDENMIKIGLLFGGFAERKLYEVRVGPAEDDNVVIVDPTDPRMIFSENAILEDYTAPIKMKSGINTDNENPENDFRRRSDVAVRVDRDAKLKQSDGRIAEDMPEEVKAKWETYRQKLRDIPQDWAAVPNHLIRWPTDPDGEYDDPYVRNESPDHEVILVAKRTAKDNAAIAQLTPIAGIDE
tara:strand:- start:2917 stop:3690 length:774 start_codon:yes stop_codon:yes gene_type:complete